MRESIYYDLQKSTLLEFKKQLKAMEGMTDRVIENRRNLIAWTSATEKDKMRIESKINPDLYYKFQMFDIGCEIVKVNRFWNEEEQCFRQTKDEVYSIKYYNCRSRLFEDKRTKLPFYTDNTCYGQFENIDVAKSYFRKAIVDILVQYGGCNALNPLDFM